MQGRIWWLKGEGRGIAVGRGVVYILRHCYRQLSRLRRCGVHVFLAWVLRVCVCVRDNKRVRSNPEVFVRDGVGINSSHTIKSKGPEKEEKLLRKNAGELPDRVGCLGRCTNMQQRQSQEGVNWQKEEQECRRH